VSAAGFAFLRSPVFRADTIVVRGAAHLSQAKILRLAGIHPGLNVVSFDAGAAEQRLESDPWVAAATVAKELPGGLTVTVRERTPLAGVRVATGWQILSSDRTVLGTPRARPRLPILQVAGAGGDPVGSALAVLAPMSAALRDQVATVTVAPTGGVSLALGAGVEVIYGSAAEADAKAQSLEAVLAWAAGEHADLARIDVQVPGAPTAALVGGQTVTP
jgi:cell division protein FtsQ